MNFIRLAYFSRNRLATQNLPMQIAQLMTVSVANNARDGITGALIYDSAWFAQILEGPEQPISTTFERILRDTRHSDVSLIGMQPVSRRQFGTYPMVSAARGDDNLDLFRHYGDGERFEPQLMRADRLCDLIEAVVGRGLASSTTNAA